MPAPVTHISFHPSSSPSTAPSKPSRSSGKQSILPSASQIGFSGAWLTPPPRQPLYPLTTSRPQGPGLTNLGNTCFLNSIIQSLVAITSVASMFLQHHIPQPHTTSCPSCAMHHLTTRLHPIHDHPIPSPPTRLSPRPLASQLNLLSPLFSPGRQEDAHEFLRALLDALAKCQLLGCTAMNARTHLSLKQERDSAVHRLFGGMLQSVVRCSQCPYSSTQLEPFLDLSLETASTVPAALARFCHPEQLDGNNRYRCDGCKSLVCATKRLSVRRAPNILCLHLKRFDGRHRKNSRSIRYPQVLDFTPAMLGHPNGLSARYELQSLVVHIGESRAHGHYRAFVKCTDGTWCLKDDGISREVTEATALRQEAYILFYSRIPGENDAAREQTLSEEKVMCGEPVHETRNLPDAEPHPDSPPSSTSPQPSSSEETCPPKSLPSLPSSGSDEGLDTPGSHRGLSPPKRRRSSGNGEEGQGSGGKTKSRVGPLQILVVGNQFMQEKVRKRFTNGFMRRARSEDLAADGKKKLSRESGAEKGGEEREERRSESLGRPRWLGGSGRSASPPKSRGNQEAVGSGRPASPPKSRGNQEAGGPGRSASPPKSRGNQEAPVARRLSGDEMPDIRGRQRREADASPPRRGLFKNVGQWVGAQESSWEGEHVAREENKKRRAYDEWDAEYDQGKTRKVRQKGRKFSSQGFNPFDRKKK